MTSLTLLGDTSGSIVLDAPAVAGSTTLTLPATTGTVALTNSMGVQVAEQWVLTADFTNNAGDETNITTNLALNTITGYGSLNQGMTQSSGVFTFPSTGYWLVQYQTSFYTNASNSRYVLNHLNVTTNNSTYSRNVSGRTSLTVASGTTFTSCFSQQIVNVTSTANVKVKFSTESQNSITVQGQTSDIATCMMFIKLG
jgi:hypothetical protein